MGTINRQLNIREGGNSMGYQQDLYMENWDKDILGTSNVSKGNAVVYSASGCSSCSSANGEETHSNLVGITLLTIAGVAAATKGIKSASYPNCKKQPNKAICDKCKSEAKSKPRSAWTKDGKENYNSCVAREQGKKIDESSSKSSKKYSESSKSGSRASGKSGKSGSNTALWIVGGVILLGGIGFAAYKLLKK